MVTGKEFVGWNKERTKGAIHKGHPVDWGRGVKQMQTLVLILPLEGQILQTQPGGEGSKMTNFCGRPLWMPPKVSFKNLNHVASQIGS